MSQLLTQNQETSLQALGGTSPVLMVGIGWHNKRKDGLLNKLKKAEYDSDLDLSCVMYDGEDEKLDTVWYAQLRSKCGGVRHKGDEVEGAENGDDETITIDLNGIDPETKTLFFVVSSFTGQQFAHVDLCYWRIFDPAAGRELARFNFTGHDEASAKIIMRMSKAANGVGVPQWQIKALDEAATGKNIQEIVPEIRELLGD